MPSDLTVSAISAPASDTTPRNQSSLAPPPQPAPSPAAAAPDSPNPTLRLDPSLGIVVIEFRSNSGLVTNSIPSERQLAAYHQHGMPRDNPDIAAAATTAATVAPIPATAGNATAPPAAATSSNTPTASNASSASGATPAAPASGDTASAADHSITV